MTQVSTIQPGPNSGAQANTLNWGTGLFSCCEDVSGCIFGALCPCILLCNISNRLGEGYLFPCCCGNVAPLALRAKVRYERNIQGSLCNDALVGMCFSGCALCQMDRELKAAGK
ncbi:cornifelin homolog B-like [Acropora palmata]|uniref:cornifelin homolog B-like n=1 Tax=Acropora palmata TaxID=6131 RepID=UPI003D9FE41F